VHYWANLQSVHGLCCYANITRTRNVSEYTVHACTRSMPSCRDYIPSSTRTFDAAEMKLKTVTLKTSGKCNLHKAFDIRPHRHCIRTVQSHSPGSANVNRSNTCIFGPTRVHIPNGILIGSAGFAWLTIVTDRQSDRPIDYATLSVTTGRILSRA